MTLSREGRPEDKVQILSIRGCLHVKLKLACSLHAAAPNYLKLLRQLWTVLGSFGQLHATRMQVLVLHVSTRPISAFSVSQSDAAVLAHYYAYHRSPVAWKPGHLVVHGTKGAKVVR